MKYVATIYFETDIRSSDLEQKLNLALEQWLTITDVHVEEDHSDEDNTMSLSETDASRNT